MISFDDNNDDELMENEGNGKVGFLVVFQSTIVIDKSGVIKKVKYSLDS